MEHGTGTAGRLDDLAVSMREGFTRVDQDIRDVRGEIDALRQTMFRVGGGMIATMCIGFLSVLAAVLIPGA